MSGALVFALFIASWWPCPERHSATVVNVVLRWTPWFGIMAFGPIVRNVDSGVIAAFASWLALLDLLIVCGTPMIRPLLSANGVGRWLYSVVILVQFTPSFLSFPQVPFFGEHAMGKYGVSFVEILILFEVWLLRDRGPNTNALVGCWLSPSPPLSPLPSPLPLPPRVQIRVEYKVPSSLLRSLGRFGG